MKKVLICLFAFVCLTACGNRQLVDTTYTYDYAIIEKPDGKVVKVEIDSWRDFEDGDQIQIKDKEGTTYLVYANNVMLVKEGN